MLRMECGIAKFFQRESEGILLDGVFVVVKREREREKSDYV